MTLTANSRPREVDIDVFGMSHVGNVRHENQDQHFAATLQRTMRIWSTSIPEHRIQHIGEPVMALLMVADGVGGRPGGKQASETAVKEVWSYLAGAAEVYWTLGAGPESAVLARLGQAVEQCHLAVRKEAELDASLRGMATTLTMATVIWPRVFVVQVGDSRCYRLRAGRLARLTTDLTSAIGSDVAPVTTAFDLEWDDILLLCTDGLTDHLGDDDIRDVLAASTSARSACLTLVDQAVRSGAMDNVTAVVGRLK